MPITVKLHPRQEMPSIRFYTDVSNKLMSQITTEKKLIEVLDIRTEVMEGRTFLSFFPLPSPPRPAKTPEIIVFILHIALESIPQLKCLTFQLMMNHDVYLSKYV